ncbi:MAG: DUF6444 domain-containing protein [Ktedonobacteraceae bacterium]
MSSLSRASNISFNTIKMKALQDRLAKDSHNSHLPPSSDRFVRRPKSLRTKSEKKSDGQQGLVTSNLSPQQGGEIGLQADLSSPCLRFGKSLCTG